MLAAPGDEFTARMFAALKPRDPNGRSGRVAVVDRTAGAGRIAGVQGRHGRVGVRPKEASRFARGRRRKEEFALRRSSTNV
jgi:hypothetical protein